MHKYYRLIKRLRKPEEQSRMDNQETLATLGN